jgi:hypothetical protein
MNVMSLNVIVVHWLSIKGKWYAHNMWWAHDMHLYALTCLCILLAYIHFNDQVSLKIKLTLEEYVGAWSLEQSWEWQDGWQKA